MTFADFENILLALKTKKTSRDDNFGAPWLKELALFLQKEPIRASCSLLLEHSSNDNYDSATARRCTFSVSPSPYVTEIFTSFVGNALHGDAVVIEDNKIRYSQRAVPSDNYYGRSAGRVDNVLIV